MSSKGWELFTFSDFVTINPSVKLDSSTEYSFVEMKNLNENYRYVSPSITRKLTGGARFQEKDTLFARITPCLENGKICQVTNLQNGVGFGSTEFLVFRGKAGISDSDFVYYLSRSAEVRKFAELNMLGTSGRQRVTWKAFNNLQLTLPPLPTQHSIVEKLSALDDKIELNRQTNATLEAIAQAIFKEWFVDFNYPGATGEMVDSPLGPIPKDWRVGSLSDICLVTKGISYKSSELQSSKTALVTLKSINRGGGFNNDGFKEYIGKYKPVQTLNEGDLVLAQTDLTQKAEVIGSPAIVENPFEYETLVASLDIAKCEPRNEMPSSNSLHHFLQRQEFKDYCLSQTNGSTVLHLRTSEIPNYELIIPDTITLQKFDLMVTPIRESVLTNNKQNRTLEAVRDKLLPKLINGEIEV